MSVFGVILVGIFPHLDSVQYIAPYSIQIQENTNQNNSVEVSWKHRDICGGHYYWSYKANLQKFAECYYFKNYKNYKNYKNHRINYKITRFNLIKQFHYWNYLKKLRKLEKLNSFAGPKGLFFAGTAQLLYISLWLLSEADLGLLQHPRWNTLW